MNNDIYAKNKSISKTAKNLKHTDSHLTPKTIDPHQFQKSYTIEKDRRESTVVKQIEIDNIVDTLKKNSNNNIKLNGKKIVIKKSKLKRTES